MLAITSIGLLLINKPSACIQCFKWEISVQPVARAAEVVNADWPIQHQWRWRILVCSENCEILLRANLISTVQIPERLTDRLIQVVTERCSAFDLCCSSHLTEGWLQEILINMKIRVIKLHIDLYQRFPMDLLCSDSLGNAFPPPYKSVVALERVQFLTFHSLN